MYLHSYAMMSSNGCILLWGQDTQGLRQWRGSSRKTIGGQAGEEKQKGTFFFVSSEFRIKLPLVLPLVYYNRCLYCLVLGLI